MSTDAAVTTFGRFAHVPDRLEQIETLLRELQSTLAEIDRRLPPQLTLGTPADAARVLGVSVQTVRRRIKDGEIAATKIGHTLRIDLTTLR